MTSPSDIHWGAEHWISVGFNAFVNSLMAAIFATLLVFLGGAAAGFLRIWRNGKFRHPQWPASAWGLFWGISLAATVWERFIPRRIGGIKAQALEPYPGYELPRRRVAVLVHGTFGRAQQYDWTRWKSIVAEFPKDQWQVLRFAWDGGNSSRARELAATALADHVRRLRSEQAAQAVVLLGHSHGGTVCEDAARQIDVEAVVAIATPHVADMAVNQKEPIILGVITRTLGPLLIAGFLGLLGVLSIVFGDKILVSLDALALVWVIVGVITIFLLFARLVAANSELVHRLSTVKKPMAGTPRFVCVQIANDGIIVQAKILQNRLHVVSRILAGIAARQQTLKSASGGWWSYVLEGFLFSALGTVIIFSGALIATYGSLPTFWLREISPWVFPAENFSNLKFVVYTVAIGVPYVLLAWIIHRRLLPPWHLAAFQFGSFAAMAARLSQLYSFKAGLLGLRGLALHIKDIAIIPIPPGAESHIVSASQPAHPLALHSVVLELDGTCNAIRTVICEVSGKPACLR